MDFYRVVFEHHKKKYYGGEVGTRFTITYKNKFDFLKQNPLEVMRDLKILARGISSEEAEDLVSLTPEVCHLTRAVKTIIHSAGKDSVSLNTIDWEFDIAQNNIRHQREHRQKKGFIPRSDFPFVDVDSYQEYSVQKIVYGYIKDNLLTADGTINDLDKSVTDLKKFMIDTFIQEGSTIV